MPRFKNVVWTLAITMISFSCIWGAPIQADGYGQTGDEARVNARNELAATIQTRVASKQTIKVSEYVVGKTSQKEELFFDDTQVTVSLELFGVEFSPATVMSDKRMRVTASLTEKSIPQYHSKVVLIKQNIESIEARNKVALELESRKQNLLLLMSYYEDFESYAMIITTLDPDYGLPELTNTKAGVQLDLIMLLSQERDALESEMTGMATPSLTSEAMQSQAQIHMETIRQRLNQNQREADLLQATYEQQQRSLLELADLTIKKSIDSMRNSAEAAMKNLSKTLSLDPQAMIQEIEGQKQAFIHINENLEAEYKQQSAVIEQQYQRQITELRNKEYRTGEKVGGMPTEEAKEKRQKEINGLVNKKTAELQAYRKELEKSVRPQLNTLSGKILSNYKKLDGAEFSLQSIRDEIQFKIGNYDGYRKSWPVAVRISVLGAQFSFDLYIPYEKITGKSLPNFKSDSESDLKAYDEYLDQVDLFETFLLTTHDPIFIEAMYKVSPGAAASQYYVIPEQLKIKRADTGKVMHEIPTAELYKNIAVYASKPSISLDIKYESYYSKKIASAEVKQTTQKPKATQKTKITLKNNLENRSLYYREGFYLQLGMASLPSSHTHVDQSTFGIAASVAGYYTPFTFVYVGGAVDLSVSWFSKESSASDSSSADSEDSTPATTLMGVFPLIGLAFPIELEGGVLRPFVDVRFAIAESMVSILNLGLHFTEYATTKSPLDLFLAISVQMSGLNAGLWSLSVGVDLLDVIAQMRT